MNPRKSVSRILQPPIGFIILDNVKGETVTIFFAAAAVEFEEGLPKVEQVPDTVEWMDTYARV
jgi:hypothetical protein